MTAVSPPLPKRPGPTWREHLQALVRIGALERSAKAEGARFLLLWIALVLTAAVALVALLGGAG